MRGFASCALVALAACASGGLGEDVLVAQAPVVNLAAHAGERMGEREAGLAADAAEQAFLRGDDRECLRIVKEALASGAPDPVAGRLRALRFEARRRLLSREVVEARVVARRDYVAFGEEAAFGLVLRNLSSDLLSVPVSSAGASDAVFVLDWARSDFDVYGNVRTVGERALVPLPEDIELAPAGRSEVPFSLPTGAAGDRHRGFSVVEVRGTFRPSVILAGEERYYESVELRDVTVRLLPPGFEPIAADPVGTLRKAIALDAREHLLAAGELVPRERRREVVHALLAALGGGVTPGLGVSIAVVLGRVTGVALPADPAAWIAWQREGGPDGLR